MRVAAFVTPHGFGHAARAAAVMEALLRLVPSARFEIFTLVPDWFFASTLPRDSFVHHEVRTDVGLIQASALTEDPAATVEALDRFLPLRAEGLLDGLDCRFVLSDIAPLGIAAAKAAGVPSVLVENFTWDWIYEAYLEECPGLRPHADHLRAVREGVDLRIRTEPVCGPEEGDLTVAPVSRAPRHDREEVRATLGVPDGGKLVVLTMGGIPWDYGSLARLREYPEVRFVIPGAAAEIPDAPANVTVLPWRLAIPHPDLVAAADAVIGKVGYSTVAEVWRGGAPMGYVPRRRFPESPVLEEFVRREIGGVRVDDRAFADTSWTGILPELLALPRREPPAEGGAEQAAACLAAFSASSPQAPA